ncbi:MAG: hypothetical protein U0172_06035 [Nitrospiraceae bacterium]
MVTQIGMNTLTSRKRVALDTGRFGRLSWASAGLRVWSILWMLVLPLVHIHPETDLHHEAGGHVHTSAVHTVFSPDLDGEFAHRQNPSTTATEAIHASTSDIGGAITAPIADANEVAFSLLHDSTDRSSAKPATLVTLLLVHPPTVLDGWPDGTFDHIARIPIQPALSRSLAPRAPPSLVS